MTNDDDWWWCFDDQWFNDIIEQILYKWWKNNDFNEG